METAGPTGDVGLTLAAGSSTSTAPGVRDRRWALSPDEVTTRHGIPVTTAETTAETTAVDLGRTPGPVTESVALVDALVVCGAARPEDVRAAAAGRRVPARGSTA
ncbi:hypothetical protein [Geodermatophilus amargosae]|uniref:hypothetical protein n=1 Tax=Geodermatophilus amargosae TaxID=1296565 RepID=UPI0034DE893F